MGRRQTKVISLEQAVDSVEPGCRLALGGAVHTNRPAAFVRELVRRRSGPVALYSSPGSGWDADLLIAAGLVSRAVLPMVTMGQHGLAPSFRGAVEAGELEASYLDAMTLLAGYLAAGYGHPYHLLASVEGTDMVKDDALYETLTDSAGNRHRAVRAIEPELCVLHAEEADEYGNVRHRGPRIADVVMARASQRTIVTVERIVTNEEVRREPHLTTIPSNHVTAVVHAPFGAHPTATADYTSDEEHLALYHQAAEARRLGDPTRFDAYLADFIEGPRDALEYLEAIGGAAREQQLREEMSDADA